MAEEEKAREELGKALKRVIEIPRKSEVRAILKDLNDWLKDKWEKIK